MPIFHVHSPDKLITASPKKMRTTEWMLDAFLAEQAKITLCEAESLTEITPHQLRSEKLIPRRTAVWLHVDPSGEGARVSHHLGRNRPSILGYDGQYQLAGVHRDHTDSGGYNIGPGADYAREFAITGEAGKGITYRFLLGAMVLHRTNEEADDLLQSFENVQAPRPE